jgi:hypothetical protein
MIAIVGAFEKIILIATHWGKSVEKLFVDMDMASGTTAASPAQCQEFVGTSIPNGLHERYGCVAMNRNEFPIAASDLDLRHEFPFLLSASGAVSDLFLRSFV